MPSCVNHCFYGTTDDTDECCVGFFQAGFPWIGFPYDLGHESWSQEARVPWLGLPVCENSVILLSLVLTHYQSVTDGQTDTPPVAKSRFSRAEREKKICLSYRQSRLILATQAWKQTSSDPSGQTWNYRGITLLYNFTTALLYMVSLVTMARIVSMLLNIYETLKIKNK